MSGSRTYLDFNATAPLRPAVRDRMVDILGRTGNPSSVHAEGRAARAIVEEARGAVSALFGADIGPLIFTSGATEALALALSPHIHRGTDAGEAAHLFLSATEHPAALQGHRFPVDRVSLIPVLPNGLVDGAALEAMLDRGSGRALVALQAANSETGVIQPVAEIVHLVHAHGGLVVCDCAQSAGKIDCRFEALQADAIVVSAHKLGGPQGVGALALRSDEIRLGAPLMRGGGQERGLRSGTENVAAIAGFAVAAREIAALPDTRRMAALRGILETRLRASAPDVVIFGEAAPRLPNTTAFALPGLANETVLIALDLAGVAISTGSACSSGKVSRSHVLEAMGVDDHLIGGLIRVSLGWSSSETDVDRFIGALETVVRRVRNRPMRSAA